MQIAQYVLLSCLLAVFTGVSGCQTGYPDTEVAADPANSNNTGLNPDTNAPDESPVDQPGDSNQTDPDNLNPIEPDNSNPVGPDDLDPNEPDDSNPIESDDSNVSKPDDSNVSKPDDSNVSKPDDSNNSSDTSDTEDTLHLNGWTLIWSDEFEDGTLNESKWSRAENGLGGGNNELQYYTQRTKNAYIEDGFLIIEAIEEEYSNSDGVRDYTSARLSTLNKGDFLYGRIEIKAKLAEGQGLWSAISMLPSQPSFGDGSASGEINIMDAINIKGSKGNETITSLQFGDAWPDNVFISNIYSPKKSVSKNAHTYAIEWEPLEIRWYVDNELTHIQTDWWSAGAPYPAPFNKKFHLALNLSVGGNWAGNPNEKTKFPQSMQVDYVRIYQSTDIASTEPDTETDIDTGQDSIENVQEFAILQAEDANVISGAFTTTVGEREVINFFSWGNYLQFNEVDFLDGRDQLEFVVAQDYHFGYIEVRLDALDGPIIADIHVGHTDGWTSFKEQISELNQTITGVHSVFIISRHLFGAGDFDYFKFSKKP